MVCLDKRSLRYTTLAIPKLLQYGVPRQEIIEIKASSSLYFNIPLLCVCVQAMRAFALADNKDVEHTPLSLFNYFVNRCRENLHIILAFSPIGDTFRNRMRMFPSLINCCTIDWFQAWPDDALGEPPWSGVVGTNHL